MGRRKNAGHQWAIWSITVKVRDGPARLTQAYRFLALPLATADTAHPTGEAGEEDANACSHLCAGLDPAPETDPSRGAVNGLTLTVGGGYGPATAALGGTVGRARAPWGHNHHKEFRRRFNHDVFIAVQSEDLPCPGNQVTLDRQRKDTDGIPAARVTYTLHPNDEKLLVFGTERAKEAAIAAGAFEIDTTPLGPSYKPPAWHLMGTCRMGMSPNDSVTNRYHQAWDIPNLFICDGSSMPTGGACNPTSTIGALALRCADMILDKRHEL